MQPRALGVGIALVVASGLVGLGALNDRTASVVQAVTTFWLLAVTAAYVVLTRQMVKGQQQQLEQSATAAKTAIESNAIRAVWLACHRHASAVDVVKTIAALTANPSFAEARKAVDAASTAYEEHGEALSAAITAATPELPDNLAKQTWTAGLVLARMSGLILKLRFVLLQEHMAALTEVREPGLARARDRWTTEIRPTIEGKPEWEDVVSGAPFAEAVTTIEDLSNAAYEALRPT